MTQKQKPESSIGLSESVQYLAKHLADLQNDYAGQWVALSGCTVKLSDEDLASLQEEIEATCPAESLLIDYVPLPNEVVLER